MSNQNYKVLIIGDFHLFKTQKIKEEQNIPDDPNVKWVCSQWTTIKSAKKEYFKYRKDFGAPHVVVLSVGNNDLTKVSSEHCVITSLLRLGKTIKKNGASVVVICSLVERFSPVGPYNEQVKEINRVLYSNAGKIEWLFYFPLWVKTRDHGIKCLNNGRDLNGVEHIRIRTALKKLLVDNKKIKECLAKERGTIANTKGKSNRNKKIQLKETSTGQKRTLFLAEIERLRGKINLLSKEKTKTQEYLTKLKEHESALNEYVLHLENISSS